ncbi:AAA-domain-containing protein [Polychaeton citri CBS 116435]|uniref:AAA-domain-containing protein n=1 Tax=Polychaeton citri CBS 116435 TaxID=1314669 RepID=A0A9P4PYN9_9PEZI|nr:AAA-domain-containing protein [Polychaeton citri CBS 116435]
MIRKTPAASMQKTYDECYLTCSTAIYFEGQNNEPEALRAWRNALDTIYYHNAYKIPSGYSPRSETEKALQDSLRAMELQCKERVDLLEALKKSREEAAQEAKSKSKESLNFSSSPRPSLGSRFEGSTGLGDGTVPQASYADLPRPSPGLPPRPTPLPMRPSYKSKKSSAEDIPRAKSLNSNVNGLAPPISSTDQPSRNARTPSPEKKGTMLRTLRSNQKDSPGRMTNKIRTKPPTAAANAATKVWGGGSGQRSSVGNAEQANGSASSSSNNNASMSWDPYTRTLVDRRPSREAESEQLRRKSENNFVRPPSPSDFLRPRQDDGLTHFPSTPQQQLPSYPDRAVGVASATQQRQQLDSLQSSLETRVNNDPQVNSGVVLGATSEGAPTSKRQARRKAPVVAIDPTGILPTMTDDSLDDSAPEDQSKSHKSGSEPEWEERCKTLLKRLPKGVDEASAKQILNEIVIQGDEVHWDDVAGLDIAKGALKETVVYPFLRPDLFMGLREPARGMLLFGPPGTGKTMLARAVATESKSVFFAISASSLTSKFLGESEKLVRALFACAKALAPSIIFVDEIDSLLGSRGGSSEHEATRRIKTEFLIQWSDLQKAAAGRESNEGDATRVLVLAATNLPWAIDEAARRRFVRRQYIPLPEEHVRETQLRTLLSAQKHSVSDKELKQLVVRTDNFSGSDITALAKDAAMGPLRSLGEQLLHMSPEDIRPISMQDFKASLVNIRPSVSQQGLKEFEDWAREFGERGG